MVLQYESRHGGFNARGNQNGMVDMSKDWTPGTNKSQTIGWIPQCKCSKQMVDEFYHKNPVKPCTVLDPFMGSGTVALVAYKHGRRFVGIELSKIYLDDICIPKIERAQKQRKLSGF